jgi:NAD(P)H-dependent flavin oxidoreductase YrpB (nitropropane dioxygenase family)
MLTTPLCSMFGIEVPIILAPMGTCTSAELAASVSNAGGLGGIGTLFRSFFAIKRDIDMVQRLTQRPFAVNHIPQTLDAEAFAYTLQARPAVISFTLADPGDLVRQAHDAGARVMVQVTTVDQAVQAAERGADVISAQGSESGGYCGEVSTMTLVPQVVDAVQVPVIAAGGIADGRGVAAALKLGASAAQIGTAFLACEESNAAPLHREKLFSADARRTSLTRAFSGRLARSVHNDFIDAMRGRDSAIAPYPVHGWLIAQFRKQALAAGRIDMVSLWSGQGAPLLEDRRARELFNRLVRETANAMESAG